ncbi:MAG: beta-galactosidase [bacterium]
MRKLPVTSYWLLVTVAALGILLARPSLNSPRQVYGVSFSAPQADWIGLDWRQTYDALLDDLGVRRVRLSAYWDRIEPEEERPDFEDLDYQMDRAAEKGAAVILAIGRKLPRWPECHEPEWVQSRTEEEKQRRILEMLWAVVERYKGHPALTMWQLENEPLFDFGECPPEDHAFLAQEEAVIRTLDSDHPILVTDSGELNSWLPAARYGDVLGTTMYRTVFSGRTHRLFSYDYIFPSWLYRAKARLVKLIRGKEVIIAELQGEPWGSGPYIYISNEERQASFSPARMQQLQRFAQRTQLPEAYWWGAEYWYWEKEINDNPAYWEIAREFFAIEE